MAGSYGNKNALGHDGSMSGRKSAYQELRDADFLGKIFVGELSVEEAKAKLKSGKYSIKDVWLSKLISGSDRHLSDLIRKLFPDIIKSDIQADININFGERGIEIHTYAPQVLTKIVKNDTIQSTPNTENSAEGQSSVQSDSVRTEVGQDDTSHQSTDTGGDSQPV